MITLNFKLKTSRYRKGSTVIELIIYMGILAVILVVFTQLFGSAFDIRRESEAVSYATIDSRYIFNRMLYDIGNADSITTPATQGNQGSTLQFVKNGTSYTYQLSNSNLVLNSNQINSFGTTISNLNFHRLGNAGGKHSIRVSYTVTSRVRKSTGQEVKNIITTVGLR